MWLKDKVAVVTGAANGIGRASALRLAREGAHLALLDIEADTLADVAAEVRATGRRVLAMVVDMTDPAAVAQAFETVHTELGATQVLVNNVGRGLRERAGPFWQVDPSTWDWMLDICLKPAMASSYHVLGGMVAAGGGKIVNIASDSAIVGTRAMSAYAAAKGGVIGLTRSLAKELAVHRINVNAIAPGFIATRAMQAIPQPLIDKAIAETPLGFMGEPEDIANVVAFLASDQSRYMTGQTLIVNGGRAFN